MPAATRKRNYRTASLRTRGSIHTVRLQALMDAAQKAEIGERIKQLRNASRETANRETNRSIADYCGVSVEAVRNWIAGKGITYDNATKVAELFQVDRDWLWRGRKKGETPDLLDALSAPAGAAVPADLADRLEWIEGALVALATERGLELDARPSEQDHQHPDESSG